MIARREGACLPHPALHCQWLVERAQGGGAFLNGQRIRCSGCATLPHALLATEVGTNRDADTFAKVFGRIQALAQVRRALLSVQPSPGAV
jgi:fructose-1,6-bisphosphatase/inositol monophosphatase family enzyme